MRTSAYPPRNPRLVETIEGLIGEEIELYKSYSSLLDEETRSITRFKTDKVEEITEKRSELHNKLLDAQDRRLNLLRQFAMPEGASLTDLLSAHFHPDDSRRLARSVRRLREEVSGAQRRGREHSQLTNFALKIVHGTLSIIWSATQNVVKSYSRQGTLKEAYNPTRSREIGVLKKA